jgi:hypothetical protein
MAALPKRDPSPTPSWLLGICARIVDVGWVIRCNECGKVLCTIDQGDSLWILADVSRDHRKLCRDSKEPAP